MARISAALSQGKRIHRVLVLEPTTTAWMYQGDSERLRALGDSFFQLLMSLESAQVEYDLGSEDIIARHGGIGADAGIRPQWSSAATFRIGKGAYHIVVLPPGTENLDRRTCELLRQFLAAGGTVLDCASTLSRINGEIAEEVATLPQGRWRWEKCDVSTAIERLQEEMAHGDIVIRRAAEDGGILFHQRRELDAGQLLFLVNTSDAQPARGTLIAKLRGMERWNPGAGVSEPYPFQPTTTGLAAEFDLPPCGSLLLLLTEAQETPPAEPALPSPTAIPPMASMEVRRMGPNVLTLDYVDVTAGSETRHGQYFYAANRFIWEHHGMDGNPWDSAVQFKDKLIRRTFPPDSGFEAAYRFTIEGPVPPDLAIVIERPDLYTITCNGSSVAWRNGEWWLDKSFGRIPLRREARSGENVVVIRARPFTIWHELEPAYVLGSFTLEPLERGWVIKAEIGRLESRDSSFQHGTWNEHGHPFHAEGFAYEQEFDVAHTTGKFLVSVPDWRGAVARVVVNGKAAGWIITSPDACEVTEAIRPGRNRITVMVTGTLRNTLGPHHVHHRPGSAWPSMFQSGPNPGPPPGRSYSTLGYGLFQPFVLARRESQGAE
jgi:hypothetical protein